MTAGAAIFLVLPLLLRLGVTFGPSAAPGIAALAAWTVTAAVVLVDVVGDARRRIVPIVFFVGAAGCIGWACSSAPFDVAHPRPDSLLVAVDADRNAAWWVSMDPAPDDWTRAVLGGAEQTPMPQMFPRKASLDVLHAPAPAVEVDAPRVTPMSEEHWDSGRGLSLRVVPPGNAELLDIHIPTEAHVTTVLIPRPRRAAPTDGSFELYFFGAPPTGIEMFVTTRSTAPLSMRVVAQSPGFPAKLGASLQPRPADRMPRDMGDMLLASDMTLVSASFRL